MKKLIVKNLKHERNFQTTFSKINIELVESQLLQVVGENGAGKSTLLKMLAGLIDTDVNHIAWQNVDLKNELHFIGHQNGLRESLTIEENLHLMAWLHHHSTEHLSSTLKKMQLHKMQDQQIAALSAGQKRRVSLSKLILIKKPIWILDEPTTALDDAGHKIFNDLLNDHLTNNGIAIIATHQTFSHPNSMLLKISS